MVSTLRILFSEHVSNLQWVLRDTRLLETGKCLIETLVFLSCRDDVVKPAMASLVLICLVDCLTFGQNMERVRRFMMLDVFRVTT